MATAAQIRTVESLATVADLVPSRATHREYGGLGWLGRLGYNLKLADIFHGGADAIPPIITHRNPAGVHLIIHGAHGWEIARKLGYHYCRVWRVEDDICGWGRADFRRLGRLARSLAKRAGGGVARRRLQQRIRAFEAVVDARSAR